MGDYTCSRCRESARGDTMTAHDGWLYCARCAAVARYVTALGHSIAAFCRRQRVAELVETLTTSARGMADAADSAGAAYSCGDRLAMRTAAMLSEECGAEHAAALTELAALALAGGSEGT